MSGEFEFHVRDQIPNEEENERVEKSWKEKIDGGKCREARAGDHILVPFGCEKCVFLKLKGRYPLSVSREDRLLFETIRRANLDAFWSRERSTVGNTVRNARKLCKMSEEVGLGGPFTSWGPMPRWDYCGYEVAVGMLLASRKAGRHSKTHMQYQSIRHLGSCYSNFFRASSVNAKTALALDAADVGFKRIGTSPTATLWFSKFTMGLGARMGEIHKPNLGLSTNLILEVLRSVERDIGSTQLAVDRFRLIVFGAYVALSYVLSLRGVEGLMLNLSTIITEIMVKRDYLVIGLRGKLKGERIDRDHLLPCTRITSSGIKIEMWLKLLVIGHKSLGRTGGPAITDPDGSIAKTSGLDALLHDYLTRLHDEGMVFPVEIKDAEDISERFSVYRSLRRASDTRAMNMKVSANDIDVVNRWKRIEGAKGRKAAGPMRQHYAELSLLVQPFIRYTKAM